MRAARIAVCIAFGLTLGGCGGSGTETIPPAGALSITPSSFTAGTYRGTYSDPDGAFFGTATTGTVTWAHTATAGDSLLIDTGYGSAMSHLVITGNERQDLVDGTINIATSGQIPLVFNSYIPGTFHGQGKSVQSHLTIDLSWTSS